MTVLDEIFANKRMEVEAAQAKISLAQMRIAAESAPIPANFLAAISHLPTGRPKLIAEIKKASPSKGLLSPHFDPTQLAATYHQNGAAALSILTDQKYFMGHLDDLRMVAAQSPHLPILRKDFIFSPYQILEARASGASAILLIAAMLDQNLLVDLYQQALNLDLAVLIEVHNLIELERTVSTGTKLIGINNRNLHDLKVNIETTFALKSAIPSGILTVSESGIQTSADIDRLAEAGISAILVGEALVTAQDIPAKVRSFSG